MRRSVVKCICQPSTMSSRALWLVNRVPVASSSADGASCGCWVAPPPKVLSLPRPVAPPPLHPLCLQAQALSLSLGHVHVHTTQALSAAPCDVRVIPSFAAGRVQLAAAGSGPRSSGTPTPRLPPASSRRPGAGERAMITERVRAPLAPPESGPRGEAAQSCTMSSGTGRSRSGALLGTRVK